MRSGILPMTCGRNHKNLTARHLFSHCLSSYSILRSSTDNHLFTVSLQQEPSSQPRLNIFVSSTIQQDDVNSVHGILNEKADDMDFVVRTQASFSLSLTLLYFLLFATVMPAVFLRPCEP